jgi:hypothetical protein
MKSLSKGAIRGLILQTKAKILRISNMPIDKPYCPPNKYPSEIGNSYDFQSIRRRCDEAEKVTSFDEIESILRCIDERVNNVRLEIKKAKNV